MRPKVSTGYLTPQSSKKDVPKNRSGSMENINGACEINEDIFQNLMSDPLKRQLILNILSSEKHKIDAYKKSLKKKNQVSPFHEALKKPCESPTALHRRRVLQQQCAQSSDSNSESGSSRPPSRQSEASTVPSPVCFDKILDGVVAFVEVKSGSKDRSEAVRSHLRCMGAVVSENFTKDVTHVIFKDGLYTTYQKANLMNVHLVSVLWLEACKTSRIKVSEKKYPAIGTSVFDHNVSALCSQMQKEYEEIVHEELQRSIQTGNLLPSTKSLIDRRRTLMTPNSMEVANITRGAQKAGFSATGNTSCTFDDDSDIGPLIDGDIIERDSDMFEDFSNRSDPGILLQKMNQSKSSHTNNTTEDMDLTDIQGDALSWNSKENLTPNIYNQKTPKINSQAKNTNTQSVNFLDENLCGTKELNDSDTEERPLTPRSARIFNKTKLIREDSYTKLTPHVHVFSKNASRRKNKAKSADTSDSNLTNMSVLKLPEKSSSMSSLQISENSNNNINHAKNSLNSTKSFSPMKSTIFNILENLQNTLDTTAGSSNKNKKSSESNCESCDSFDDLKLKTPTNKNVTLRKKLVIHVTLDEAVRELEEQNMFSTSVSENEAEGAEEKEQRRKTINEIVKNLEIMEDKDVGEEQDERRTRTTFNKKFGERNTESSDTGKLFERKTVGEEKMPGPSLILSEENVVGRNRTSVVKNLFVKVKTNEIPNFQDSKKQRRYTVGPSKNLQKNEEEKKYNKRKTSLGNSPSKHLKLTPSKERCEDLKNCNSIRIRKETMSSSILNSDFKKQLRRCRSSTDLDANEDSPGKKKYRKLYTPTDFKELAVSDEKEREEKRKVAKKKSKSGVFIKPTIFTQKEKVIVISPTENLKQMTRKSNKKTTNNKNVKQYDSDEDKQVELEKEILNKKNNICDETPKKTIPKVSSRTPKATKTPRQSQRILSIKTTSINRSQRRSTLEFQSINQSGKKRLKIDAVKKPSIVCTKLHRPEVQTFTKIVKKIGGFDVEDQVSEKTTHLVAGEPKRTVNMLKALAMGCWIVKKDWLHRSLESGKWLPEEDFEETDFSPAVQKNRIQRQAFGPSFSSDIFQDYGPIYIAKNSVPKCSDLRELIQICKGRITATPRSASIVVGESVSYNGVTCVKETWILDCISQNKKYPFKKYLF